MALGILSIGQYMAILIHHLEIYCLARKFCDFIFTSDQSLGMNFINQTLVVIWVQLEHDTFHLQQSK